MLTERAVVAQLRLPDPAVTSVAVLDPACVELRTDAGDAVALERRTLERALAILDYEQERARGGDDRHRATCCSPRARVLGGAVSAESSAGALVTFEAPLSTPSLSRAAPVPRAENPALVYLASLAAGSRPAMRSALETTAAILTSGALELEEVPWAAVRYPHLQALRARLSERYAPKTMNRYLSAVRGVLRAAWRLGQIDTDTLHRACTSPACAALGSRPAATWRCSRGSASSRSAPPIRCRRAARATPRRSPCSPTGVRRAEAVALDLSHVDVEGGAVRVRGKGNKERLVYLVEGARRAI